VAKREIEISGWRMTAVMVIMMVVMIFAVFGGIMFVYLLLR